MTTGHHDVLCPSLDVVFQSTTLQTELSMFRLLPLAQSAPDCVEHSRSLCINQSVNDHQVEAQGTDGFSDAMSTR